MSLQDAIDAAIYVNPEGRRQGGTVVIPQGHVFVPETIKVHNVHGLRLIGHEAGSRLVFTGPAHQHLLEFAQSSYCSLERVELTTQTDACESAILLSNLTSPGDWVTTACRFIDVQCPHTGGPGFKQGINIDSWLLGAGDTNNEHHLFERVVLNNYIESGVRINGGQIHQLQFRDCHFTDHGDRGLYGINGHYGNYWSWNGGSCSRHHGADFYVRDFVTRVEIRNFNGELSSKLLATGGPTGSPMLILLDGIRWDGKPVGNPVVQYMGFGPLVISNCVLTSIEGEPCRIMHYPPAGMDGSSISIRNVTLAQVGGEYAPWERPISFPPGTRTDEFGLSYRHIHNGQDVIRPFYLNWPDDLSRGAVELPELPVEYTMSDPFVLVDLSGQDMTQGWTVSVEASFDPDLSPQHPHVFAIGACKLWLLSKTSWRLEHPGVMLLETPYDGSLVQQIAAGYDRESGRTFLTVNGVTVSFLTQAFQAEAERFSLAEWPGYSGSQFNGTLDNVSVWSRLCQEDTFQEAV